ncbi:hypothetical protein [Chania multitudinisentens]|nr:hypothetical protein [Chania multitudinisentens]
MKSYKFDQISIITAITNELSRQHPGLPADHRINTVIAAANNIVAEYGREPMMAAQNMGLTAWINGDDTGASSLYMAYSLAKVDSNFPEWPLQTPRPAYPRDVDDLGRCIRLIEAVPGFGGRIPEMAHKGAHWMSVTSNWADWVAMYQSGDLDRLDAAMEEAFAKAGAR